MKKTLFFRKSILLFVCLLFGLHLSPSAYAQITSFPWIEGFENGGNMPAGFTQQQVDKTASWGCNGGSRGGSYKAIFSYDGTSSATTKLITPRLDISGLNNPALTFWYTQENRVRFQSIFRIYYRTSSAGAWVLLQTYSDNIANWTKQTILLPNGSSNYYLAFEGVSEQANAIGLDDIKVGNFSDNDAGAAAITWSYTNTFADGKISTTLKNFASNTIDSMVVKYQIGNNTPVSQMYKGKLTYLSETNFTFTTPVDISMYYGSALKVWTELPNDENRNNDTATFFLEFPTSIYHPDDKAALRDFLRQSAPTNYEEQVSGNYTGWYGAKFWLSISDTALWQTYETWIPLVGGLTWNNSTPKRLIEIDWRSKGILGKFKINADSLIILNCESNQITDLDVSKNTKLDLLACSANLLTDLYLSKNTELTYLYCSLNQIRNLYLSQNTKLTHLYCSINKLTYLNLSENTELTDLACFVNQLRELDLSKNTKLVSVECYNNQLAYLNVTQGTQLAYLNCSFNQLTHLDVTQNTELTYLNCLSNRLPLLDLTQNTQLIELHCGDNRLPLARLDTLSKRADIRIKKLGAQDLSTENLLINVPVEVDTVFNGMNTVFLVQRWDGIPIKNTDYKISNNGVTFFVEGIYCVITRNPGILCTDTAKVFSHYNVSKRFSTTTNSVPFTENFEAGTTNFTIVNNAQVNHWVVGDSIAHSGRKSIYISNNAATNTYNTNRASLALFYCNVEFTPSNTGYQLSFDYKGMGEQGCDYLTVSLADTAKLLSEGLELGTYVNEGTWQHITLNIPASYVGTVKTLIFTWHNNANGMGEQSPAAIDNISIKMLASQVAGITLNERGITIEVDKSEMLTATIAPDTAYNKTIIWNSRNPGVAWVDKNGVVTGVAEGTTYIIATTQDGSFIDSCLVTVLPSSGIVDITTSTKTLKVYPNPVTNGKLKIESGEWQNSTSLKDETISIYNIIGTLVGAYTLTGKTTEIDIANLPKGSYLLKVGKQTVKVIKN